MQHQTVDALVPLLTVLQQPAFCVRANGTITYNEPAKHLIPSCAAALPQWLGDGKPIYDMWDRTDSLQLPLTLGNQQYSVTLQALQDGTLFLLSPCTLAASAADALFVASQTLRQPLADLSSLFHLMRNEENEAQAPAVYRQLHRMTRIVSNLTELTRLNQDSPKMNFAVINSEQFLGTLFDELDPLFQSAQRKLLPAPHRKAIQFRADEDLLRRAILNLFSNALKFSPPETPITFRTETIGTHLVFQVENVCTDGGDELLRAAFSRLTRRELLPDPKWGVGLGLPLANAIAKLHGGMVAVETNNGKAIVSLSVSIRCELSALPLASLRVDYTGGMRQALLELSDVLPNEVYGR